MSQPTPLQEEFLGMFRDKSRDQLPRNKVWNMVDWIPEELGAPLSRRGGWDYYDQTLTSIDASAGKPARVAVSSGQGSNHSFQIDASADGATDFTLTFSGQTTGTITYGGSGPTAQAVEDALVALSNIAAADIDVTKDPAVAVYTVAFQSAGAYSQTDLTGQLTGSFTGGSATLTISTIQTGGPGTGSLVVAIDDRANPEFFDITNGVDEGSVYGAAANAPLGPMVSYRGRLLIPSPALAAAPVAPRQYYTGSISALGGSPPGARFFAIYKERVVLASADTDLPNRVYFSAAGNAESWDTTSRYIDTSAPPVALAALRNSLLIFHEESVERIRGSIPPGSAANNMELEPLFDNVGLADPFALHVADEFVYWADEEGVYRSDGSSFTDLTKQGGISSYWHEIQNDADSVGLTVWRGYVWVSLMSGDTEVDFLLFHIDKRYWFRFSNIMARHFAILKTEAEDDLLFANRDGASKQLGRLATVFGSYPSEETDGEGDPVEPVLETGVYRLDAQGQKRWKNIYLNHDLLDGGGSAPNYTVSYVEDPSSTAYTSVGSFTDTVSGQKRRRLGLNRALRGVGLKFVQTNQSGRSLIYSLEADVYAREGSRRSG